MGSFLPGTRAKPMRVGELDEEMVFEQRTGDTFILGASTWRIEEITHDRVLVTPAPGEPGKMPFWHGDQAGRPLEFGRRIGALVRELREMPRSVAVATLTSEHDLDPRAAENVMRYLADQELATTVVPDDRNIVIERVRDELGDWRVCVLTPFGSRIHAPWAMAATAKIRANGGPDVETMWREDGFVLRFPETDDAAGYRAAAAGAGRGGGAGAAAAGVDGAVCGEVSRERVAGAAAAAAQGGWAHAAVAAAEAGVRPAERGEPVCELSDPAGGVSRVPARCVRHAGADGDAARRSGTGALRVHTVDSRTPSPFAAALLFSYVANYIYDGDAPLAERRAQALSIDQDQLRELMGDADLRELLDLNAIEETEEQLQCLAESYQGAERWTGCMICCCGWAI